MPAAPQNKKNVFTDTAGGKASYNTKQKICGGAELHVLPYTDIQGYYYPYDEGGKIALSYGLLDDPELARFVLAHECGHRILEKGSNIAENGHDEEYAADCWAVRYLLTQQDFAAIYAHIALQQHDPLPDSKTHPSSKKRIESVKRCAAEVGVTL